VLFAGVAARMTEVDVEALHAMLEIDFRTRRTTFDRLRKPARAPTLSKFREHLR
jgi:hypothetical protein